MDTTSGELPRKIIDTAFLREIITRLKKYLKTSLGVGGVSESTLSTNLGIGEIKQKAKITNQNKVGYRYEVR